MKNLLIILLTPLLCTMATSNTSAQEMGDIEKMKIFSNWVGRWQGEGSMQMGPGEPRKSKVDEHVESKLDGMVLLVEGIGKAHDASRQEIVVHHALAVLSYDKNTEQYKFRSFLKDGRSTDAWLKPTGENTFQWGFDIPGRGKTRYSIVLDPVKKTWDETGEFSQDGTTWMKFFSMHLTKTE